MKGIPKGKLAFFEREMIDLAFTDSMKEFARDAWLDGLEIMSKKQIRELLEEYNNEVGGF